MEKKRRLSDGFIKVTLLAAACLCTLLYLIFSEAGINRMQPENGVCVLSAAQLDQGVWLLEGVEKGHLSLNAEQNAYLSIQEKYADGLRVNGNALENIMHLNARAIIRLEAGVSQIDLGWNPDVGAMLHMGENRIRIGRLEALIEEEQAARLSKSFFNGFFIFSILFALTLFVWKPSETYLLIYVLHALLFFSVSIGEIFAGLAQLFPVITSWMEESSVVWNKINRYGTFSLMYPLITAAVHWLLYRVFVDDRIYGVRYPVYLTMMYVLLAAAMIVTGGLLNIQWVFFLFYFVVYLCEGFILLQNRTNEEHAVFRWILLVAWCVSFMFWLVRTLTNLGFIRYAGSVGSLIAVSYTIGFLVCINGKFSHKFLLADKLLQQTQNINERLEVLVEEKTEDLKASYAHLEQVQREKNEFVSNIIHNLKTPLFSLQGYAELLGEEMQEQSKEAKEYLALVRGNVDYAQQMIRHLLLFNRLEEKRIRFTKISFDLGAMLRRMADECAVRLQEKRLQMTVKLSCEPLMMVGDELYLRQAVQNLIDNAIEHSVPDGRIDLTGGREGEFVLIAVQDYGEGIASDVLAHIMERCYSFHADGQKSSGLGLNIAQAIAAEHGGEILVESALGEGSRFALKLPIQQTEGGADDEL